MSETVLINFVLPTISMMVGWLGSAYRNKQKREGDIIANFQLMRDADKEFMIDLKTELLESKKMRQRLEAKLDRKNKSIRKANQCPHTAEGDGCPVLIQEEKNEHCYELDCASCGNNPDKEQGQ